MSVRVTSVKGKVSLYDSSTGFAFGPVFDTADAANGFLVFLEEIGERDPRLIPAGELAELAGEWQAERE